MAKQESGLSMRTVSASFTYLAMRRPGTHGRRLIGTSQAKKLGRIMELSQPSDLGAGLVRRPGCDVWVGGIRRSAR